MKKEVKTRKVVAKRATQLQEVERYSIVEVGELVAHYCNYAYFPIDFKTLFQILCNVKAEYLLRTGLENGCYRETVLEKHSMMQFLLCTDEKGNIDIPPLKIKHPTQEEFPQFSKRDLFLIKRIVDNYMEREF